MSASHDELLKKYLQLPDRLEAAVAGLDEAGLDLKGEGWSIRQYVHHTVEGELLWEINLRAAAGYDGIAFPMTWYFVQGQDTWADCWGYDRRPIEPALALFRGSTSNLVGFLRSLPEPLAMTFTVIAVFFYIKGKPFGQIISLSLAGLTQETTLLVSMAFLFYFFGKKDFRKSLYMLFPLLA